MPHAQWAYTQKMDVFEAIERRHTVLKYTTKPVEEEKIQKVLEAARWGPSGANCQPWDFVVVTDSDKVLQMRKIAKDSLHRWMKTAMPEPRPDEEITMVQDKMDNYLVDGVVFIVAGLTFREDDDPKRRAKREISHRMNYQSLGLALENLMLAATALDLGTHWIGATALMQEEIQSLLGIPYETEVVTVIALGYPSEGSDKIRPRTRLPEDITIHHNGW